jgi:hypothetical protein
MEDEKKEIMTLTTELKTTASTMTARLKSTLTARQIMKIKVSIAMFPLAKLSAIIPATIAIDSHY